MNVNPSERRGTVFSAFTLCDDLGKGLGPSIASWLQCDSVVLVTSRDHLALMGPALSPNL